MYKFIDTSKENALRLFEENSLKSLDDQGRKNYFNCLLKLIY